jgi:hypothetical protein
MVVNKYEIPCDVLINYFTTSSAYKPPIGSEWLTLLVFVCVFIGLLTVANVKERVTRATAPNKSMNLVFIWL